MRTWRGKFVFLLIVYFAGFATAIYTLAPVTENQEFKHNSKNFTYSTLKTDEFAQSFNTGMHKCLDFSKDLACRMGKFLKQKFDERHLKLES